MPYVDMRAREELDAGRPARSKGELNYKVTQEAIRYIDMRANAYGEKVGYTLISEAIAALRDAADEMQRRLLAPYEDSMIQKNGDCYPTWLLVRANVPTHPAVARMIAEQEEHEGYIKDKVRHTSVDDLCNMGGA